MVKMLLRSSFIFIITLTLSPNYIKNVNADDKTKQRDEITLVLREIENNIIEKITKNIDSKINEQISTKYESLAKQIFEEIEKINRKIDVIHNETETLLVNLPDQPQILPGERYFTLVEINQDAKVYSEVIKKKNKFVEVKVIWETQHTDLADTSIITLGKDEVWTGPGNASSASFNIYKGGIYELKIKLCNKRGCSYSDATDIVVADTDGSHISPMRFNLKKAKLNRTSGKIIAATYVDIFSRDTNTDLVSVNNLTHFLYSFVEMCGCTHEIDRVFPGADSCTDNDKFKIYIRDIKNAFNLPLENKTSIKEDYYDGTFSKLMLIKQTYPNLKILATVGGLICDPFSMLHDNNDRGIFVASLKEFLETWKLFDGVVIGFNYAQSNNDTSFYGNIVKDLRKMTDELSAEQNKTYILTALFNNHLDNEIYSDIDKATDFVLVKNFAFKGPWSYTDLGYHTSLFAPAWKPEEKLTTNQLTKELIAKGISPEKIVISVSAVGYGWTGVQNYTNDNLFTGVADRPFNRTVIVNYKYIVNDIAEGKLEYHYDETAEAAYVFNKTTGDLVTYDDVRSSKAKVKYVKDNQLAGVHVLYIEADNGDIMKAISEEIEN